LQQDETVEKEVYLYLYFFQLLLLLFAQDFDLALLTL